MKLSYHVTGAERKKLVGTISTILNAPTKYLGAPTFAYEIGGYHIDKDGTLTGPDNLDLEDSLHQAGFDADGDSREYDEPDTYESGLGGMGALDELPDIDHQHPGQYAEADVQEFDEGIGLVIDIPREGLTETALENLKRLLESKGTLIKKALGAESLDLEITDETIRFPWFADGTDMEAVKAYTHFVTALCETAKTQQRVNATEKPVENEKYTFRCFLLRLGFIGSEYKEERKILLSKLSGNSAYKINNSKAVNEDE